MTDICESNQPVQGSQHHQHAEITWISMNHEAAKRDVKKLQEQIFQTTHDKNFHTARRLKKLLFISLNARFLAVLTVTSKQCRYIPGVDGIILKTPEEKWNLVEDLRSIKNINQNP